MKFTVCCSPAARDAAGRWKARLHRNLGLHSLIVAEPAARVVDTWEEGGKTDAILLVLDRETAPVPFELEDWRALREHDGQPPVAYLKREECAYPKLLERHARFLPYDDERAIERWLVRLFPERADAAAAPTGAAVPEGWWQKLVDSAGTLELPASEIDGVQQFAHDAEDNFEAVAWIVCGDRPLEAIKGELEYRVRGQRMLVVLDHVADGTELELPKGRHSYLLLRGHAEACRLAFPSELQDQYENPVMLDRRRNLMRSARRTGGDVSKLLQTVFKQRPGDEWLHELPVAMRHNYIGDTYMAAVRYLLKQARKREAIVLLRELAVEARKRGDLEMEAGALHELSWQTDSVGIRSETNNAEQISLF
ncbi:MAG: hypothetical protein FJW30_10720 [Acidobacteria bacterium]|nr:hypothetical protein [Acidobacteriota bacterium]